MRASQQNSEEPGGGAKRTISATAAIHPKSTMTLAPSVASAHMRAVGGHLVQGPAPAQTAPQKISNEEYARLTYPEKVRYPSKPRHRC